MRRLAIAIGVVVVLGAGAALWALTRPGKGRVPGGAPPGRVQRGTSHENAAAGGAGKTTQTPADSRDATAQKRDAEGGDTNGQSAPADRQSNDGRGNWGPASGMSDAERARLRAEMVGRMLDQAGLSDQEKKAARKAVESKERARQTLAGGLADLRRISDESSPTDRQLRDALTAYRSAMARYRKQAEAEDRSLEKQLSLRARVRCLSLGILDNGLGGMRYRGMGAPRPSR
jgi:hypothetical protein